MDLSTKYMGLKLSSPLVASASPLSTSIDSLREMEDAGASAVVLWSLFEEQVKHESEELDFYLQYGTERFAESLTYFPQPHEYHLVPDKYVEHIALAKQAVKIPIIASLNGISTGGWLSYARKMQQAGADGLELNVYFIPTDPRLDSRRIEDVYLSMLKEVRSRVTIPVAMKLSPFFTSTAHFVSQLDRAGANAVVLFNRFYQPDIDIDELDVRPNLQLSTSAENRLPMRWMAILYSKVKASLAASGGIHTAQDVMKMILAGADVTMMCSALLENGARHLTTVRQGLVELMEAKGYGSVSQMRGAMSQSKCPEPAVFERANYMKALHSYGQTATLE